MGTMTQGWAATARQAWLGDAIGQCARRGAAGAALAWLLAAPGAAQVVVDADVVALGAGAGAEMRSGSGTPEGAITGSPGDLFLRTNPASSSTILYLKSTGTGNTGWVAVLAGTLGKSDLPAAIAYEDESNVFTLNQTVSISGANAAQWSFTNTTGTGIIGLDASGALWNQIGNAGAVWKHSSVSGNLASLTTDGTQRILGDLLPTVNYTQSIGNFTDRWGSLYAASLEVNSLVSREIAATAGGRLYVAPSTVLVEDVTPTATAIAVRDNIFSSGSRIHLEGFGKLEEMAVTSGVTVSTLDTVPVFDESNDTITGADIAAYTLPDADWEIAGWVKLADNVGSGDQTVFSHGAFTGNNRVHVFFRETSAGASPDDLCFNIQDADGTATGDVCSTSNPGALVVWTHVALTRASGVFTLYVNGASVATTTNASIDAVDPTTTFTWGARNDSTNLLGGRLSSWTKWNRSLTGAERGILASGGKPDGVSGRIWAVPFDLVGGAYSEEISSSVLTINGGLVNTTDHPFKRVYSYSVSRANGGSAAYWQDGDAVVDTSNGFIDLYASHTAYSPRLDYVFQATGGGVTWSENQWDQMNVYVVGATSGDVTYYGLTTSVWQNLYYKFLAGNAVPGTVVVEYWNGSTWTSLVSATVSTNFWTTAGLHSITWSAASQTGWTTTTVNGVSAYWVRLRNVAAGSMTVPPTVTDRRISRLNPTYGPTIAFNTRYGTGGFNWAPRTAIGNLIGLYGYTTETYGFATGNYAATAITIDDTNGYRILNNGSVRGQWDTSGVLTLGNPSAENIQINSTDFKVRDASTDLITINGTDGIVIPTTATNTYSGVKRYGFNVTGEWGLWSFDDTERGVNLDAVASGKTAHLRLRAHNTTSFWDTSFEMVSNSSNAGYVLLKANGGQFLVQGHLALGAPSATTGGLPSATNNGLYMEGGVSSTVNGRIYVGDGAANDDLMFSKRTGGTTTDLIAFEETGRIGIGTAAPAYQIELSTDSAGKPTSSTWTIVSDRRTKRDIEAISTREALERVRRLRLVSFEHTGALGTQAGARGVGVVAQEARAIFPDSVRTIQRERPGQERVALGQRRTDDVLAYDWHESFVSGLAAIQALASELDTLRREVETLKKDRKGTR